MEAIRFKTLERHDARTVAIVGCIEEHSVAALRQVLREASDNYSRDLTVDLSEVVFLPSSAIGVLVGALRSAAAAQTCLRLEAREGTIARRVLDICGIGTVVSTEDRGLSAAP